ncbi:MAG: hypothetical protein ACE5J7_02485 [Candidatus Aenigmatarchaeota archaeon]
MRPTTITENYEKPMDRERHMQTREYKARNSRNNQRALREHAENESGEAVEEFKNGYNALL